MRRVPFAWVERDAQSDTTRRTSNAIKIDTQKLRSIFVFEVRRDKGFGGIIPPKK